MSPKPRPIYEIADEIVGDWITVSRAAYAYLRPMRYLKTVDDMYMHETAKSVIRGFLGAAGHWRGDVARRVKIELKNMLDES